MSRFFSRAHLRDDINIAVGLVMTFFSIAAFVFFRDDYYARKDSIEFLIYPIIFNAAHISTTMVFATRQPLFKGALPKSWRTYPVLFLIAFICVVGGVFFLHKSNPERSSFLAQIIMATLTILPGFHILWQIKGINLVFTRRSPAAKAQFQRQIESYEKKLFYALFTGYTLAAFLLPLTHTPLLQALKAATMGLQVISILGLLLVSYLMAGQVRKTLFLLRLIVLPLQSIMPPLMLPITMMHCAEYFLILWGLDLPQRKTLMAAAIGPFVLILIITLIYYFPNSVAQLPAQVFFSIYWGIALLHYFLDRRFFRMKDPYVRTTIGPLLVPKN